MPLLGPLWVLQLRNVTWLCLGITAGTASVSVAARKPTTNWLSDIVGQPVAVGHKDELVRCWGQRSRSQQDNLGSDKHFWGHFLTSVQNAITYYNETYRSCLLVHPNDTSAIYQGYRFQGKGHTHHFLNMYFSSRDWWFTVKNHLV